MSDCKMDSHHSGNVASWSHYGLIYPTIRRRMTAVKTKQTQSGRLTVWSDNRRSSGNAMYVLSMTDAFWACHGRGHGVEPCKVRKLSTLYVYGSGSRQRTCVLMVRRGLRIATIAGVDTSSTMYKIGVTLDRYKLQPFCI